MTAKNTISSELEAKVEEIIKKALNENQYICNNSSQSSTSQNIINSLTEDDKSLIKDLFWETMKDGHAFNICPSFNLYNKSSYPYLLKWTLNTIQWHLKYPVKYVVRHIFSVS